MANASFCSQMLVKGVHSSFYPVETSKRLLDTDLDDNFIRCYGRIRRWKNAKAALRLFNPSGFIHRHHKVTVCVKKCKRMYFVFKDAVNDVFIDVSSLRCSPKKESWIYFSFLSNWRKTVYIRSKIDHTNTDMTLCDHIFSYSPKTS